MAFSLEKGVTHHQLHLLNRCWLFLQVTCLSDIVTGDGRYCTLVDNNNLSLVTPHLRQKTYNPRRLWHCGAYHGSCCSVTYALLI